MLDWALSQRPQEMSRSPNAVIAAIPCLNTQDCISDIVRRAGKYVDKVIVVNDGSVDNTAQAAQKAGAVVINHSINRGYGEALKSCFQAARALGAEILVILDGDGQHNPDEIPQLVRPVLQKEADVVIGSRFLASGKRIPGYRKLGIRLITFLWNIGSGTKISDTQSGFRAYSQQVVQEMRFSGKGMGVSIEILQRVRRRKWRIYEAPITCSYENNNASFSIRAFLHGAGIVISVLKFRFQNLFARNDGQPGVSDVQNALIGKG